MKYYVCVKAKNGLILMLANLKFTNGKKWTTKTKEAFYFHTKEDAQSRVQHEQFVADENELKSFQAENIATLIAMKQC